MATDVTDLHAPSQDDTPDHRAVGRRMRRGGKVVALSQAFLLGTQMLTSVLLARLLAPGTFGVFQVVVLVTLFVETVLLNMGTGMALVQRSEISDRLVNTVFWFNLLVGAACTAAVAGTATWLAPLLGSDRAVEPLRVSSLIFLAASLAVVPRALLRRRLRSGWLASSNLVNGLVNALGSVLLVWAGAGIWGLTAANVASTVVGTAVLAAGARWRPRLQFSRADLRSMRSYGANFTGYQVLSFLYNAGDRIIVGQLGERPLGLYAQSNRLLMYPTRLVSAVTADVLVSGLARLQGRYGRLQRAFCDVLSTISAGVTSPLVSLGVLAGPFTAAVLGDKWHDAAPIISILAPVWIMTTVGRLSGTLLQAIGRTDLLFRWGLISTALTAGGYLAGLHWGVEGVAWGFLAATVVVTPLNLVVAARLIGLSTRRLTAAVLPFAMAGLVQAAIQYLWLVELRDRWAPWAVLVVGTLIGTIAYGVLLRLLAPAFVGRLLQRRKRVIRITTDSSPAGSATA